MPEESEPPRVNVALPGGRQVPARLLRWKRAEDGGWRAEVVLSVPAAAVGRVEGEDYTAVGREEAAVTESAEKRYVLEPLPPGADGKRLVLHVEGCWAVGQKKYRPAVPVPDAEQARSMLRFANTTACEICTPTP